MKILIMGGAGMIGQKLLNLLLKKEKLNNQKISEITLFDIIEAPYPNNTNIPIQSKSGDISDIDVSKNLILSKPDIIFHLAAKSHPTYSFKNPIQTIETNVMGTLKLFEICKNQNINPKIVVACSSAQFG